MTNYEKCKEAILRYQRENPNYKVYKKEYDKNYRAKNNHYASFRVVKCNFYKNYGEEIGKVKLTAYLIKQATKGIDVLPFLSKM